MIVVADNEQGKVMSKHYIKRDAEGRDLPDDATVYAIVFDPSTGLEWLADFLPEHHNFRDAGKAAAELDLAGGGWRLPAYHEAVSIVDPTRHHPARDPVFRGAIPDGMWTGTTDASAHRQFAWVVTLNHGYLGLRDQTSTWWVRPCRFRPAASAE
jgi:hypothetical protein